MLLTNNKNDLVLNVNTGDTIKIKISKKGLNITLLKHTKMRIYGVLNNDDCLIDTSLTEKGAKRHATNNGYTKVGYRIEYHVTVVAEKVNNKWININN